MLIVAQNVVGIGAALALDLHPVIGLFGGSITLVGGHGTGAAYAGRLGETMNLQGVMELAMAAATAGLVLGAVLGGPITEYLIKRHSLSGPEGGRRQRGSDEQPSDDDEVNSRTLINALFVILVCLAGGKALVRLVEHTGFILPDFVFCLLLGVVIRNASHFTPRFQLSAARDRLRGRRGAVAVPGDGADDDEAARPRQPRRAAARDPRRAGGGDDPVHACSSPTA